MLGCCACFAFCPAQGSGFTRGYVQGSIVFGRVQFDAISLQEIFTALELRKDIWVWRLPLPTPRGCGGAKLAECTMLDAVGAWIFPLAFDLSTLANDTRVRLVGRTSVYRCRRLRAHADLHVIYGMTNQCQLLSTTALRSRRCEYVVVPCPSVPREG